MRRILVLVIIVVLGWSLFWPTAAIPLARAAQTSPKTPVLTDDILFQTDQASNSTATELRVGAGCDVNGDGYQDAIVGRRGHDYQTAGDDNGRAWLFYGSAFGLDTTPARSFDPPYVNSSGYFGAAVSCDLDVNGDGFDDILIGMEGYEATYTDEGAVFAWYGSATGPAQDYDWMARGYATSMHLGVGLDSAGDVNGDGYDDIIVAGWDYSALQTMAFVWYGSAGGLGATNRTADWTAAVAPNRGAVARGIGDVNGDGWDDVMLGIDMYDGGVTDQGVVYAWFGSATGLGPSGTPANADWSATGVQQGAHFGCAGDGAGDLNGDGSDDVAIGAFGYDNPEDGEGSVFVWYGSPAGLGPSGTPANADWRAEANFTGSYLGFSLGPGGDVNADGYADLLVGAYGYTVHSGGRTIAYAGAWFVWQGAPTGLGDPGTPDNADVAWYGDQVSGALSHDGVATGDFDRNGYSDILAAASLYDLGQTDEGVVFAYYWRFQTFLPLIMRNQGG